MEKTAEKGITRPTTLAEIQDRATIPLWSDHKANYCGLMDVSRALGYREAKAGRLPTIEVGGRILVSVPALLAQLDQA